MRQSTWGCTQHRLEEYVLEKILTCECCHQITRMKEGGISNIYIDDLMKKISCSFRGTFLIDKIPTFKDEKFSIIVNLSKENEKGTHFIGISSSKDTIIYFDSSIEKYLKKYRKKNTSFECSITTCI